MNSLLLDAALSYAERGWQVMPTTVTKKPITIHGVRDATNDPRTIQRWFDTDNHVNVAIALGRASNLAVLDIDAYKRGCAWPTLEREYGLPDTFTVLTPRRGTHHYFHVPPSMQVRSRLGFATFVELRSSGMYVLAPPSRTCDGEYTVVNSADPVLIPDWISGVNVPDQRSGSLWDMSGSSGLTQELLLSIRQCLPSVPHQNHDRLFRLSRVLLTLKASPETKQLAFQYWYQETARLKLLRQELTFSHYQKEFLDMTKYVQVPVGGDNVVKRAWRDSRKKPFPKEADQFENPWVKKVVRLCWELDVNANGKEWFLACSTLADAVGVQKRTATRYLREMIKVGVLKVVKEHTHSKARRFRYVQSSSSSSETSSGRPESSSSGSPSGTDHL